MEERSHERIREEGLPGGLARLDVFVGEWTVEAAFPDGPSPAPDAGTDLRVRTVFEWLLGGASGRLTCPVVIPGQSPAAPT